MTAQVDEMNETQFSDEVGLLNIDHTGEDEDDSDDDSVDVLPMMENNEFEANDVFEIIEQGDIALAMDIADGDEDDEDADDDEIRPTDAILVLATTDEEESHIEVQVLTDDGNLFTHHDISLKDFPLCLAWMDCPPYLVDGAQSQVGNFIAVGSFDPAIEIWNLDVLDPLEPTAILGGYVDARSVTSRAGDSADEPTASRRKKLGKKKGKARAEPQLHVDSHQEAVLGLSWNHLYRQTLASASADRTVKLWDVTTHSCVHTYTQHTDKVQYILELPTLHRESLARLLSRNR